MIRRMHRFGMMVILAAVCAAAAFMPAAAGAEGVTVNTPEELLQELENKTPEITLGTDITTSGDITIGYAVIIDDSNGRWEHTGTVLFTSKDYNPMLDHVSLTAKYPVRYRDSVPLTGASSGESVVTIKYASEKTEEPGAAAEASISGSGLNANFLGSKASGWKDILQVTGVVTDAGTYRQGTKTGKNLSREYSITYKTTVTGDELILKNEKWPSAYTADDEAVMLPAVMLNGYQFLGWSVTDGSTEYVKVIEENSTGDKEFYANFTVDSHQGGGGRGGSGGYSFSGLSGLLSSSATESAASVSDISEQIEAAAQTAASNSGRRVSTGKSKTEVVFSDSSSGSLDLDGVINTETKTDHTRQILILGIGLVAVAAIGIAALLKKKR